MRLLAVSLMASLAAGAWVWPAAAQDADARIRALAYRSDAVYSLHGHVGYQVDLEFESEERFIGMSAGDVEGIAFAAQGNHLFLKPKATGVHTNLTVLTTRRVYHLDYTVGSGLPEAERGETLYALRFVYPAPEPAPPSAADALERAGGGADRPRNTDYWYCGRPSLRPLAAWDDGVHTHLRFNPRSELPAVFVRNDDGSESLLNFNMLGDDVVIHRVARQLIVRRGKLTGCIVNKSFDGTGETLESGTIASEVQRATRGAR